MELYELEKLANKEKLDIYDYKMKYKSRIICNAILMDYSKIHTYTEEKCLLAEELRTLLLFRFLYF